MRRIARLSFPLTPPLCESADKFATSCHYRFVEERRIALEVSRVSGPVGAPPESAQTHSSPAGEDENRAWTIRRWCWSAIASRRTAHSRIGTAETEDEMDAPSTHVLHVNAPGAVSSDRKLRSGRPSTVLKARSARSNKPRIVSSAALVVSPQSGQYAVATTRLHDGQVHDLMSFK